MRRGAIVAILVGMAFTLSGCQYLLGLSGAMPPPGSIGGSFDPGPAPSFDPGALPSFDPGLESFPPEAEESFPPPTATFSKGSATITIAGKVTTLDQMTEAGVLYADFGAEASWTDGKGNYLQFYSDPTGEATAGGFVQLDQVAGGRHLEAADPSACKVTVKKSDATGISGTATCTGLQWTDTMGGFNGLGASPAPIGAAFDAEISFEATP